MRNSFTRSIPALLLIAMAAVGCSQGEKTGKVSARDPILEPPPGGGIPGVDPNPSPIPTFTLPPTPTPTVVPTSTPTPTPTMPPNSPVALCADAIVRTFSDTSTYTTELAVLRNTQTSARVMAAEDVQLYNSEVGSWLFPNRTRADVRAAKEIYIRTAQVPNGKLVTASKYNVKRLSSLGPVEKLADFDFQAPILATEAALKVCEGESANGTSSITCSWSPDLGEQCTLVLNGVKPDINFFDIASEQSILIAGIEVRVPPGAKAVVRVRGNHHYWGRIMTTLTPGVSSSDLFWIFPLQNEVHFEGSRLSGAVIAPRGKVYLFNGAEIRGRIISFDLNSEDSKILSVID